MIDFDEQAPVKVISPTIREDLAGLYPDATEEDLSKYVRLIQTYDQEKLPATREAKRYKELSKQIKELEEEQTALKEVILKQYKLINHQVGDVTVIEANGKSFNMDALYSWATTNLSQEDLDFVTIKSIDDKKFNMLVLQKKVCSNDLPSVLYQEKKTSYRINLEKG